MKTADKFKRKLNLRRDKW